MKANEKPATENDAVIKQRTRTRELINKIIGGEVITRVQTEKISNLAAKHSELIDDFEVVKEMNTICSERFDEVLDKFPTTAEIDCLLRNLDVIYDCEEDLLARKLKLKSLRKICVHLDQQTSQIRPKSYAESVETKED